jgi:protein gp37
MGKTSIQWTDHSINPIRARNPLTGAVGHYCEKVSSGCANCYASNMQKRFKMPAFPGKSKGGLLSLGEEITVSIGEQGDMEIFLDESKLQSVLRRKKPTKYFWCDMTDLFGWWVPQDWIDKCFAVMALTPHHTHQILTKRPEKASEYLAWDGHSDEHAKRGENCPCRQCSIVREMAEIMQNGGVDEWSAGFGAAGYVWKNWPLPNVWIGTSVENQKAADERIPHLLKTPAAVRFLSMEPLLGPVDLQPIINKYGEFKNNQGINCDWVIIGGESGKNARPCNVEWIRDILHQCTMAGVPCFVKQLGSLPYTTHPGWDEPHEFDSVYDDVLELRDSHGGDWDEWPSDLRVREFPKSVVELTGG